MRKLTFDVGDYTFYTGEKSYSFDFEPDWLLRIDVHADQDCEFYLGTEAGEPFPLDHGRKLSLDQVAPPGFRCLIVTPRTKDAQLAMRCEMRPRGELLDYEPVAVAVAARATQNPYEATIRSILEQRLREMGLTQEEASQQIEDFRFDEDEWDDAFGPGSMEGENIDPDTGQPVVEPEDPPQQPEVVPPADPEPAP